MELATADVWIVGAGPSGVALARACAEADPDLRVGLVAPDPDALWRPNYALWLDDAVELGVEPWLRHSWPSARIEFASGGRVLERGYALVDDRRLQRDWLRACRERGVVVHASHVHAIEHDPEGVDLQVDGGTLRGKLVVDASGHGSRFVEREPGSAAGFQIAWGELWRVGGVSEALGDAMTFMDWRPVPGGDPDDGLPPTFLYAMPLADDHVFVEETVLVTHLGDGRPPSARFDALRGRLDRRRSALGLDWTGAERLEIERCVIPMGGPLPLADGRTLGFGGAASMVHPATGYLLTNVLRMREPVAAAIAEAVRGWPGPQRAASAIWSAIWPVERVRAWRLYRFGMDILADMDRAGVDEFFAGFFDLDDPRWRTFVSATATTPEIAGTMLRYFGGAPFAIQRKLGRALVGREGLEMARGLTGLRR